MAEKRKLQAEMEKVFRKVDDGVGDFEGTMAKMLEATTDNQRDKCQDDLKKEIKKLQRLRDSIKGWQNSNEIKDKEKLNEYRKIIETRMEQFKDIERENKTKPHSKQGLSAEEKLDPKIKEKDDTIAFLSDFIQNMKGQCDFFESEVEKCAPSGGKKKKPIDKDKQNRVDDLKMRLEKHKFHIQKLEIVMRLVTNDNLDCTTVREALHDDIEHYINEYMADELVDCDYVYDDLSLADVTEINQQLGNVTNIGTLEEPDNVSEGDTNASGSPSVSPAPLKEGVDESAAAAVGKQRHTSGDPEAARASALSRGASSRSTPATPLKLTTCARLNAATLDSSPAFSQTSIELARSTSPAPSTPPPQPPGIPYNSIAAGSRVACAVVKQASLPAASSAPSSKQSTPVPVERATPLSSVSLTQVLSASPSRAESASAVGSRLRIVATPPPTPHAAARMTPPPPPPLLPSVAQAPSIGSSSVSGSPSPALAGAQQVYTSVSADLAHSMGAVDAFAAHQQLNLLASSAQQHALQLSAPVDAHHFLNTSVSMMNGPSMNETPLSLRAMAQQATNCISTAALASSTTSAFDSVASLQGLTLDMLNSVSASSQQAQQPQEANIPPSLGASPLGQAPATMEQSAQLKLLEAAVCRMPMPIDSEHVYHKYLGRSPCATPAHYPQKPLPMSDSSDYYSRLSTDILFFIFYYLEGTRAQYLAAMALKKQSWRFHKKYLMWFQRHEEPKSITDDYEMGTYIYFDYEKWSQRKKENFTFEYRYLEDRELT